MKEFEMKELDAILDEQSSNESVNYSRRLAVMFQPESYSEFQAHPDFDEAYRRWITMDSYRRFDMVRLWSFVLNLKHTLAQCTGSVAELGVYKGQSSAVLSYYAEKFQRKMYLIDTFQGFSEQQFEENMGEGKQKAFKDTSLEAARAVVGNYSQNRWVVGVFPDSITDEMQADTYAFVSIDCDLYEPILEGVKFFWPRMNIGGVIFIHDYSNPHRPGVSRAVDEFCNITGARGILLPDLAGSFVLVRQDTSQCGGRTTLTQPSYEKQETLQHADADRDAIVALAVERALAAVRAEYTALPRFAYHLPLDYNVQTLPPRFDPPVWVEGESLPLPPPAERHGHAADDAGYLDWGKYDHDVILNYIQNTLPSLEGLSVMDFGCSSGRVLRHFRSEMQNHGWKLTGVDVSARRIEWLRRYFPPEFQVYTGSVLPILPFESNSFDAIYGVSVFTHIKFLWDMWLLELRRVLKPGGVLIQSIHTEHAWDFFAQHGHEDWARDALGQMIVDKKLMPAEFVYYGDIDKNQVFWKKEIALAFWSRYLRDVKIYPPPERYSYQDWIVARK